MFMIWEIGISFILCRDNFYSIPFFERPYKPGKKFCATLISNGGPYLRRNFFEALSKYKKVDSAGRWNNNIGYHVENKTKFLQDYKFSMAFENSEHSGYCTEKLTDSFAGHTIPIYWGDPDVNVIFNTKAFVWVKNEQDFDRAIQEIIKIDNDEELYKSMLKERVFNDPQYVQKEREKLRKFFRNIFDVDKEKARRIGK